MICDNQEWKGRKKQETPLQVLVERFFEVWSVGEFKGCLASLDIGNYSEYNLNGVFNFIKVR